MEEVEVEVERVDEVEEVEAVEAVEVAPLISLLLLHSGLHFDGRVRFCKVQGG